MRAIESSALAELEGATPVLAVLVEMELSETIRLCSAGHDIVFDGDTYQAIGALGNVEAVEDSPGEIKPLRFSLSGASNDTLAIALAEPIRNKPVTVRAAVLNPVTHAVLDAPAIWAGTLDQMPIEVGNPTSVITVIGQHRGAVYARPKPLRYVDYDQRALAAGDTSLRFLQEQANHTDIWPAASYYRV